MEARGRRLVGGVVVVAMVLVGMTAVVVGDVGRQGFGRHHVAGGDRGWDVSTDMANWVADKLFIVGDNLWFAYFAGDEGVAELSSKEEFESCNLANPISLYTDGLNRVKLDEEGPRYFVGTKLDSCNNGLKLHVEVHSRSYTTDDLLQPSSDKTMDIPVMLAEEPSGPYSATTTIIQPWTIMLALCIMVGL